MLNKYEHLPNGLTRIFVKTGKKSSASFAQAYINTDDFEKVDSATTESWSLWSSNTNSGVTSNIGGRFIKMRRIISGTQGDRNHFVVHANGNPLDLRRDNLVVASNGALNKESFQVKLKQIAEKLRPLPADIEDYSNKKEEPGIVNQDSSILYIEKSIITDQISFTVQGKKRILNSLNEEDAKTLIDILLDLNVKIG